MSKFHPAPSNGEMWRAYAIAPAVTPITFIAVVSMGGVELPAALIVMGFSACYLVAGLIGMPIAFWLRGKNTLNAWTIHGAAFLWGVVCSIFCFLAAIYVIGTVGGSIHSVSLTIAYLSGLIVPPVVLAGTAFWLLLKNPKLC